MAKYIKNDSGGDKTYSGQLINDQVYYEIQPNEEDTFSQNSILLSDIGSGEAVIAKDDSGTTDIADVNDAINYLKDIEPSLRDVDGRLLVAPTFEDTQGLGTVWRGNKHTALGNTLNIFDQAVTTELILRGGWYEILDGNAHIGDYVEFSIIDKDDVLGLFSTYGLTVGVDILELKKFVKTNYINPRLAGKEDFTSDGASAVMAGLYMRIAYMNTGTESVEFAITEKYHEV